MYKSGAIFSFPFHLQIWYLRLMYKCGTIFPSLLITYLIRFIVLPHVQIRYGYCFPPRVQSGAISRSLLMYKSAMVFFPSSCTNPVTVCPSPHLQTGGNFSFPPHVQIPCGFSICPCVQRRHSLFFGLLHFLIRPHLYTGTSSLRHRKRYDETKRDMPFMSCRGYAYLSPSQPCRVVSKVM
jgi:hypothetical protein